MTESQINRLFATLFSLMSISMPGGSGVIFALAIWLPAFYWRNTHGL